MATVPPGYSGRNAGCSISSSRLACFAWDESPIVETGLAARLRESTAKSDKLGFRMQPERMAISLPRVSAGKADKLVLGDDPAAGVGLTYRGVGIAALAGLRRHVVHPHVNGSRQCDSTAGRGEELLRRNAWTFDPQALARVAAIDNRRRRTPYGLFNDSRIVRTHKGHKLPVVRLRNNVPSRRRIETSVANQ